MLACGTFWVENLANERTHEHPPAWCSGSSFAQRRTHSNRSSAVRALWWRSLYRAPNRVGYCSRPPLDGTGRTARVAMVLWRLPRPGCSLRIISLASSPIENPSSSSHQLELQLPQLLQAAGDLVPGLEPHPPVRRLAVDHAFRRAGVNDVAGPQRNHA